MYSKGIFPHSSIKTGAFRAHCENYVVSFDRTRGKNEINNSKAGNFRETTYLSHVYLTSQADIHKTSCFPNRFQMITLMISFP